MFLFWHKTAAVICVYCTLHSMSACLRLISCSCTCRSLFWVVSVCTHFWRHWFSCSARRRWLLWIWFCRRWKYFFIGGGFCFNQLHGQHGENVMMACVFHTFLNCVIEVTAATCRTVSGGTVGEHIYNSLSFLRMSELIFIQTFCNLSFLSQVN